MTDYYGVTTIDGTSKTLVNGKAVYDYSEGRLATKQNIVAAGTGIAIAADGITINHSNAVSPSTIGGSFALPIISFDAQGHITGITTTAIYPPTSAGTSGQFWESDGSGQGIWHSLVASDIPSLAATYVTLDGAQSVSGAKTFSAAVGMTAGLTVTGNVVVNGNITQNGSQYITHAEEIQTTNDYIIMRYGATAALAAGTFTGLEFTKYDGTNNGRLVVDNSGTAYVGDAGSEQPLLTRDAASNMTAGALLVWDSSMSAHCLSNPTDAAIHLVGYRSGVSTKPYWMTADTAATFDSTNLITSGAVYNAVYGTGSGVFMTLAGNGETVTGTKTFSAAVTFSTIIAGSISGNAATASKLNTNAGSGTVPIYFNNGVPVASASTVGGTATVMYLNSGTLTAGSTCVVANSAITAATSGYNFPKWDTKGLVTGISATAYRQTFSMNGTADIEYLKLSGTSMPSAWFAPVTAGTSGYILQSNGSGAPTWLNGTTTFVDLTSTQNINANKTVTDHTLYFKDLEQARGDTFSANAWLNGAIRFVGSDGNTVSRIQPMFTTDGDHYLSITAYNNAGTENGIRIFSNGSTVTDGVAYANMMGANRFFGMSGNYPTLVIPIPVDVTTASVSVSVYQQMLAQFSNGSWSTIIENQFDGATRRLNLGLNTTRTSGSDAWFNMGLASDSTGTGYAYAPTTPDGSNGNQIVTAYWANSKYVDLTSAQTITGQKTFAQGPIISNVPSNVDNSNRVPTTSWFRQNMYLDTYSTASLSINTSGSTNTFNQATMTSIRYFGSNFYWPKVESGWSAYFSTTTHTTVSCTFATAFGTAPVVVACVMQREGAAEYNAQCSIFNVTSTGFSAVADSVDAGGYIFYIAMGV